MTDLLKLIFDAYSRQARLYPALLTLVPPLTLIAALWPDLLTLTSLPGLVGFTAAFGVLYALASFARSRGKQVEKRLLKVWGAWPTTYLAASSKHVCPKADTGALPPISGGSCARLGEAVGSGRASRY